MNQNQRTLSLAIRRAVEDENLTSDDVLRTIKETLDDLAVVHKTKATKAENVRDSVRCYESPYKTSLDSWGDYNRLDSISAKGSWGDNIIYGGSGTDTISFS